MVITLLRLEKRKNAHLSGHLFFNCERSYVCESTVVHLRIDLVAIPSHVEVMAIHKRVTARRQEVIFQTNTFVCWIKIKVLDRE